MNKVFTANVFLSTSREATEKVFFGKSKIKTMKDRITNLSNEELKQSLLVTQENNPGLIEMDFSLGKIQAGESHLKLVFLETDTLFEAFYLERSVESRILSTLLKELYNNTSVSGQDRRLIERDLFDRGTGVIDSNKIFFSFGVGGDLANWAGPFVMNLSNARSVLGADGVRQLELSFVGMNDHLRANAYEADVEGGLEGAVNRYSKILKNRKFIVSEVIREFDAIQTLDALVHSLMSGITKEYIRKISGSNNVIVLVPDFKNFLENYKKKVGDRRFPFKGEHVGLTLNELFSTSEQMGSGSPKESREAKILQYERSRMIAIYKDFFRQLGMTLTLGFNPGEVKISTIVDEQFEVIRNPNVKINLTMGVNSANNLQERDSRVIPDAFAPLESLINGINLNCLELELDNDDFIVQFYEETDIKILKLWKKYGFIEDDKTVAYIFGSKALVKSLLYLNGIATAQQAITENTSREDLTQYDNQTYRLDYFNTFLKTPQNSSFGENVLTVDELALPEQVAKLSRFNSLPIFRHNLANSNILSLDVDYGDQLLSVYNLGTRIAAKAPLVNYGIQSLLDSADDIVLNDFFDKIKEQLKGKIESNEFKTMTSIYEEVSNLLSTKGIEKILPFNRINQKNMKLDKLALYISAMLAHSLNLDINKPYILVESEQEAWQLQKQIYEKMDELAPQVSVRTLPFFKLAGMRVFQKPCILLSMKNSLVGTKNEKVLAPHSGLYQILGFRHVITTTECFSEFKLSRIPGTRVPQDITLPTGKVNQMVEDVKKPNRVFGDAGINVFDKYFPGMEVSDIFWKAIGL